MKVEMANCTTRKNGMNGAGRKRKQEGGTRKKRALTPWAKFVKKIYAEMKRKNANASFGEALKEASRRKSEM
jgi:hypothetical protein